MYDVRQFRPMLYWLLLIGFTGYALAAETPGLWVLAVGGTLLNAYLVTRGKFRPLPRFVANAVTLVLAAWMVMQVSSTTSIFAIGEFLTYLQLVKLYEQRGNRDIAQLLVLSLLLMVAAAISTGSLLFGILFVAYLFLSLYCCLLFHLKAESDFAKQMTGLDESKINPMTLKQDQRFLTRSMRRLTAVVGTFAIGGALLVFLLFPRGSGAGLIGNINLRPQQAMTGFSDQVSFQDVARITQNDTQVAWLTVTKNGQPWGGAGQIIYLRGSCPDTYVSNAEETDHWQWKRSPNGQTTDLPNRVSGDAQDLYEQDIRLLPTGSRTLFAMPGLLAFRSNRDSKPNRGLADDVLSAIDAGNSEMSYTVVSTNADALPYRETVRRGFVPGPSGMGETPTRSYPVPAEVREFALRDDVAGADAKGNLARQRLDSPEVTDVDEALARNFETYLRTNFKYTLDLTDARLVKDKDPLVQFLTDFKRGHCEYFAGAMTLMCQSVGMKARMVVGFKCDDYNTLGGYYVVRQSHAHAWVECLTKNGWQRFDPTSANEAGGPGRRVTLWQRIRSAMNFLEYKWGSNVVNYDSESQNNVITNAENGLNAAMSKTMWVGDLKDRVWSWLMRLIGSDSENEADVWKLKAFYFVLTSLITLIIALTVIGLIAFILIRLRLYRRARRIGLDALPNEDQLRLARQLAFYDQLLKTLERRNIVRGRHMTPREFGSSVNFLPAEAYDLVQGLTRIFYRVRYGEAELQPAQQKRLSRSVERVDTLLGT